MIRTNNAHVAFDDVHDWFVDNERALRSWLSEAARTWAGVDLSLAAVRLVEQRLGRQVKPETAAAVGYIVTASLHLCEHADRLRERGAAGRALQIAWDDAKATVKSAMVSHYTGMHPHAVAQIDVAAKHIRDEHL